MYKKVLPILCISLLAMSPIAYCMDNNEQPDIETFYKERATEYLENLEGLMQKKSCKLPEKEFEDFITRRIWFMNNVVRGKDKVEGEDRRKNELMMFDPKNIESNTESIDIGATEDPSLIAINLYYQFWLQNYNYLFDIAAKSYTQDNSKIYLRELKLQKVVNDGIQENDDVLKHNDQRKFRSNLNFAKHVLILYREQKKK